MLQISPLTGIFGAIVGNADLSQYDDELVVEMRQNLNKYKVLVVANQSHLSPEQLLRVAEEFGTAERAKHPIWADVPGHLGVKNIHTPDYPTGPDVGDSWHTDGPPRERVPSRGL